MRLERNLRNLFYVFIQYGINMISSFLLRKVLLDTVGISGVGLNSLFIEVLTMLSLTEMGVGVAITYNLYQPLLINDHTKISQLMWLFKRAYLIIAGTILIIGFLLLPFIHEIVNDGYYDVEYLRLVFALFLVQTVLSYLFAYKRTLLSADQKNYIASIIDTGFKLFTTLINIIVLVKTNDFVLYLYSVIICNFLNNFVISKKVDKIYPYINQSIKLPREEQRVIFANIKNLFIAKISGSITNSTDNMLISIFVGLNEVGLYANYALLLNAVKQLLVQVQGAIQGSMGNLYAEGDSTYSEIILKRLTFIHFFLGSLVSVIFFNASTIFISIVFGTNYFLNDLVVMVCSFNLFFYTLKDPLWQMISVSGLFKQDKYIAILGSIVNLIVSITAGNKWGITGIFLGTTSTYIIQIILKIRLLYSHGFNINQQKYVNQWIKYVAVFSSLLYITKVLSQYIAYTNLVLDFILTIILCIVSTILLISLTAYNTHEYKYSMNLMKRLGKILLKK